VRPSRYDGIALVTWLVLGALGAIVVVWTLLPDSTTQRLAMAAIVLVTGFISDRIARAVTASPPDRPARR
jgi:hypothetical protein